jgi:hypothetical protein
MGDDIAYRLQWYSWMLLISRSFIVLRFSPPCPFLHKRIAGNCTYNFGFPGDLQEELVE